MNDFYESWKFEFVYVMWRRRIWKSKLIKESVKWKKFLYFFVGKKSYHSLLNEFTEIIMDWLWVKYLHFDNFKQFFDYLFWVRDYIIVFDEFQNFLWIDSGIFYDLQCKIDEYEDKTTIKIVVAWSIYSFMKKIFESYSQPLYGRKTWRLILKPFDIYTQKKILSDQNLNDDFSLFCVYSIFWGIAKYYNELVNFKPNKDFLASFLKFLVSNNSIYITEWKDLIIEEFWRNYQKYFSILEAISRWYVNRSRISDYTGIDTDSLWKYIWDLLNFYELIDKKLPICSNEDTKKVRYAIKDNFLRFWFRYIFKNQRYIEFDDYVWLYEKIKTDITNFFWFVFEDFVKQLLIEKKYFLFKIENIGSWWDRKWTTEIDIIIVNETEKKVFFWECKYNINKVTLFEHNKLLEKSTKVKIFNWYEKIYWFFVLDKKLFKNNNINVYSISDLLNS